MADRLGNQVDMTILSTPEAHPAELASFGPRDRGHGYDDGEDFQPACSYEHASPTGSSRPG